METPSTALPMPETLARSGNLYQLHSLDRAVAVLEMLGESDTALSLAEVCQRLRLHKSTHVSTLPGSNGRFSPHWSPDGKYIAAITTDTQTLMLFDVAAQRWAEIFGSFAGYETWSHDGKYLYFQGIIAPDTFFRVLRLRLSDRKIEEIADMRRVGRVTAGGFDSWFGLAPDDSPLVTRDISTQEIYALEMDWP
jgi:hypothetical protein